MKICTAHLSRLARAACVAALLALPGAATGFTQHAGSPMGNILPMGHEWITRMAVIELLDGYNYTDPTDPRFSWRGPMGKAKNRDLSSATKEVERIRKWTTTENTYASKYKPVWDAIIGERWVDLGGTNVSKSKTGAYDCWDLVAQEPPEVQYDHFMRRYDDIDAVGGVNAARSSRERFVNYFVAAATALPGPMQVWDGGGYSVLVTVDRNYFLLGRALHLFEDSFSPDHTVRKWDDRFETVRQVKSYLCAFGSEQHAHSVTLPGYGEGDVIWKPQSKWDSWTWSSYKAANMKDVALVATEGSKDVWAAFIRTMAAPQELRESVARKEATVVAGQWLALKDERESLTWYTHAENRDPTYVMSTHSVDDGGNGTTQQACMTRDFKGATQAQKLKDYAAGQRVCLYNMVPAWSQNGGVDNVLHLNYNWDWRNADKQFTQPPADWKIGDTRYLDVRIANRVNGVFMQTKAHYIYNYTLPGGTDAWFSIPIDNNMQPLSYNMVLRVAGDPGWYLNRYGDSWGQVAMYSSTSKGHFELQPRPDGYYNIKNTDDNMYMYMYTDNRSYINRDGNPDLENAQWRIDGLPEPRLIDGPYHSGYVFLEAGEGQPVRAMRSDRNDPAQLITLKRQADGTYVIGSANGLILQDKVTAKLSWTKWVGSRFWLDKQEDGSYLMRDQFGMNLRFPESGENGVVLTDGSPNCDMPVCTPGSPGPTDPSRPPDCRAKAFCMISSPMRLKHW